MAGLAGGGTLSAAGKRHMTRVAAAGCVLGNRGLHVCFHKPGAEARTNVHHILRDDFATAGLCWGGHQGPGGVHDGVAAFCKKYRVPGETELGLLVWVNEDLERLLLITNGR